MILKEMHIHNYRVFRDVSIDFANGNKNITLILSNRGTGKTTLIKAYQWCLYGLDVIEYGNSYPICNLKSIHLANIGDELEVSVELIFDDDGEDLVIRRGQRFIKEANGLKYSSENFQFMKHDENDLIMGNKASIEVNRKIPIETMDFLLIHAIGFRFDNNLCKKCIYFPELFLIENVKRHLQNMMKRYTRRLKILIMYPI